MMRTTPQLKTSELGSAVKVNVPTRLVSLLLLATLAPLGLVVAGLIWLEDGGPVFTGSLLEATSEPSQLPSFRVVTLHLEKWDIRKLPASVGSPERLILIPTLTVIGRILTLLHLDRLPAMVLVAMGRISPTLLLRRTVIYSN